MIEPKEDPPVELPSSAELKAQVSRTAKLIAERLGETEKKPRALIYAIVKNYGIEASLEQLQRATEIEASGGMMTTDGKRRRSLGGIFFYIVRGAMPDPLRRQVFPTQAARKRMAKARNRTENPEKGPEQPAKAKEPAPTQKPVSQTMGWDDRIATIKEADTEKGQTNTVKITMIGRPGKILDKGTCIVTVMEDTKVPALPKGLPTPTAAPTKYAVYIASKQWNKVKEAIADPEDALIIEGFPKTDPQVSAIAVFATSVTTKKLQAAQRASQKPATP